MTTARGGEERGSRHAGVRMRRGPGAPESTCAAVPDTTRCQIRRGSRRGSKCPAVPDAGPDAPSAVWQEPSWPAAGDKPPPYGEVVGMVAFNEVFGARDDVARRYDAHPTGAVARWCCDRSRPRPRKKRGPTRTRASTRNARQGRMIRSPATPYRGSAGARPCAGRSSSTCCSAPVVEDVR